MITATADVELGLWFDVERRYKTIAMATLIAPNLLWFDVERRYKTIAQNGNALRSSCGLM